MCTEVVSDAKADLLPTFDLQMTVHIQNRKGEADKLVDLLDTTSTYTE